ncbi:MAG: formylglycine-generating enzyme family protein [Desulfosudis oleivorans]|nr:formylglycine-generating enzyme family protein [Desulfosudis oleivorans]
MTDGIESCKGDIKSIAPAIKAAGLELEVNIVGFDIKEAGGAAGAGERSPGRPAGATSTPRTPTSCWRALGQSAQASSTSRSTRRARRSAAARSAARRSSSGAGAYTVRVLTAPQPVELKVTVKSGELSGDDAEEGGRRLDPRIANHRRGREAEDKDRDRARARVALGGVHGWPLRRPAGEPADVLRTSGRGKPPGPLPGHHRSSPSAFRRRRGKGRVTLSWTPAAGATSYNIYYARSSSVSKTERRRGSRASPAVPSRSGGSPTGPPISSSVTAVNASGESGDSAWVMAAPRARAPRPGLVRIPAGTFRMGDSLDNTAYSLPVHVVDLDEFFIDRYETTYALWEEVYDWAVGHGYAFDNPGQNGSTRQGGSPACGNGQLVRCGQMAQRPLGEGAPDPRLLHRRGPHGCVQVRGCRPNRLSSELGGGRLSPAHGGRMGEGRPRRPRGPALSLGRRSRTWARPTTIMGVAVPVGLYPPNGYGLYDMAGNVFEWVWDWGSEAQAYHWAGDGAKNPRGPETSDKGTRIRRGGGFSYGAQHLKCFGRMFRKPTYTAPYFGFRSASNKR